MNTREIGKKYEDFACEYLKKSGYVIIERNFFTKHGEIDIIAKEKEYICFIEVKYRKNSEKGTAAEAVDKNKQKTIYNVAKYYLYKNGYKEDTACRFDVVIVDKDNVDIIKNAFP